MKTKFKTRCIFWSKKHPYLKYGQTGYMKAYNKTKALFLSDDLHWAEYIVDEKDLFKTETSYNDGLEAK
jgi:hypothetical protein